MKMGNTHLQRRKWNARRKESLLFVDLDEFKSRMSFYMMTQDLILSVRSTVMHFTTNKSYVYNDIVC